jgi:tripartite-type tricarboxylate transporter receptor subunit TctC
VFSNALSSLPHVRSGRARALAVTSASRYAAAPDLPTVAESGVPGFEAVNWYGWLAPAGTPAAIVSKLNAEIGNAVRMPEMQQRFARDGAEPVTSTPAQFSARIASEVARWRKVVKEANLRVE